MAVGTTGSAVSITAPSRGNYLLPMILMISLYFSIGFITSLNDILVPHFKDLFHLTNVLALLVQFCFFGAYFVMSLPSGWIVGRIGYKLGMIGALCTVALGLLLFVPASIAISYPLFLFALFIVGSGFALLQVAINPYVSVLGSADKASTSAASSIPRRPPSHPRLVLSLFLAQPGPRRRCWLGRCVFPM
jgi:FHS family L-fucose permease-like MFS transporter